MELRITLDEINYLRMAINDGIKWQNSLAKVYQDGEKEKLNSETKSFNYKKLLGKIK